MSEWVDDEVSECKSESERECLNSVNALSFQVWSFAVMYQLQKSCNTCVLIALQC